jgi:flagellar biosynthetic protein FliP
MTRYLFPAVAALLSIAAVLASPGVAAANVNLPGVQIQLQNGAGQSQDMALALKILLGMTVLSLAPAILLVTTAFTRIILVLSMLRQALGMQQTPPKTVLISLALFLTAFTMMPVIDSINEHAYQPYVAGSIGIDDAIERSVTPIRDFMLRQTREEDLALMLELSRKPMPRQAADVTLPTLIPAFMLSELYTAFQIGFIIFIPFLLVDIVIASLLMSLGMMMVPPMMISLPIKILMFVLIDGWNLVVRSLVSSFH